MIDLYHVTTSKRAQKILNEGFNNLSPNYSTPSDSPIVRVYLSPERFLTKWIRILSVECGWDKITVLRVSFPENVYQELLISTVESSREPFIWEWGDQTIFQFNKEKHKDVQPEVKIDTLVEITVHVGGSAIHYLPKQDSQSQE